MILPGILDKKRAKGGGAQQSMDSANSNFDSIPKLFTFNQESLNSINALNKFHQVPILLSPKSIKTVKPYSWFHQGLSPDSIKELSLLDF